MDAMIDLDNIIPSILHDKDISDTAEHIGDCHGAMAVYLYCLLS